MVSWVAFVGWLGRESSILARWERVGDGGRKGEGKLEGEKEGTAALDSTLESWKEVRKSW
jgi:hypothetical protein